MMKTLMVINIEFPTNIRHVKMVKKDTISTRFGKSIRNTITLPVNIRQGSKRVKNVQQKRAFFNRVIVHPRAFRRIH